MSYIPEENGDKKHIEELKAKYGVIKEIPKREVEEVPKQFENVLETSKEEEEIKLHNLILKLEKIDGKIDIIDRFRNDMNERVTQLAEEIGELRSLSMERERSFDTIKTDFEKNKISVTSPLGKGLMGKTQGEKIKISVPAGTLEYEILEITR